MKVNETFKKQPSDMHLQLITVWSQLDSGWLPQSNGPKIHKNVYKSVDFSDVDIQFDVVLAETDLQQIP